MSTFILALSIFSALSVAYADVPKAVYECEEVGRKKVQAQADSYGVVVDMETFRVSGYDGNILAQYVWWSVDVIDVNGRYDVFPKGKKPVLTKLTQKPLGGNCF